jgi:flagellar protein FlgJ
VDKNSPLYKVCLEFEAIFIKQMLNSMRRTVEKSGLFEGGLAEDIFEDLLYDEYAKKMAENANFGLAAMIYSQVQPSL